MIRKTIFALLLLIFTPCVTTRLVAQNSGIYIDPNRSDPNMRRSLIMNANRIETMIGNWGNVGVGSEPISGVWPRGSSHDHIHEFTGFIAARVMDNAGNKIVIISDGYSDAGGTSSEFDPVTNVEYKFHPIPGYLNEAPGQDEFANSLNPLSWPATWPGKDDTWNGKWNGFFGLNQFNADQEAMYLIDDTWNKEYPFFPFRGDVERQGLGMQIQTRSFQWAHPLAKDIIFIYFEVTNISDYDYDIINNPILFGGYGDIGMGGRGTIDDDAAFNKDMDLVYGWDHDNIGVWSKNREIPPGYMGWKFLESPGIEDDNIDNDNDGLVDERRDNPAGDWIFGPVGKYGAEKWHWSGDEDGDWLAIIDDVGADGISDIDVGYPGPDADGTEKNGIPDQGEPNFGKLDNDESDQVGLTSFSAPLFGTLSISNEEAVWPRIQPDYFAVPQQSVNQYWIFSSGPFNLPAKKTERFSTCFVFGFDEQAVFQTATVAQRIFDSDYRFAKPPRQPKLQAIAGDGRVTLLWDNLAELSRDPVYGFDFEGYRIYRSTDPQFLDVKEITDSRGNPVFQVPIAQFDIDNGLKGPHPLQFGAEINQPTGIHYYMGDDVGLRHSYIDREVINGRTYYYAVTAYDKGYDHDFYERKLSEIDNLFPITPAECPAAIIVTDGIITRMDPNTAIATPNPLSTNIEDAWSDVTGTLTAIAGVATGSIILRLVDGARVKDGDYRVTFKTAPGEQAGEFQTRSFSIFDDISQTFLVEDEAVPFLPHTGRYVQTWIKELFDNGFILEFFNELPDPSNTAQNSGWSDESKSNFKLTIEPQMPNSALEPFSFVMEFGAEDAVLDSALTSTTGRKKVGVNFRIYEFKTNAPADFIIFEKKETENGRMDPGEFIYRAYLPDSTATRYKGSWAIRFAAPTDLYGNDLPVDQWIYPQEGDKIYVLNKIPFNERDTYAFRTFARTAMENPGTNILNNIRVVPNPYIVSSILERQPYLSGRGERFIRFINLPSGCTIRIYTVNGDLVKTIEPENSIQGSISWDLISKDGLEVAFGLYVYHVEVPGVGEKIGKFAIIN